MMKYNTLRILMGMNLLAGCLFFQGCGLMTKKSDNDQVKTIPELEAVTVETIDPPVVVTESYPVPFVPSKPMTTPYTIQKGDTISGVSYRYSLRWQDVLAVNPGINPKQLRIGQVIQLPGQVNLGKSRAVPQATAKKPAAVHSTAPSIAAPKVSAPVYDGPATTYTVKSGDSLSVIAYKHGIKTTVLRAANNLKSDRIIVGQKLQIPGTAKTPAVKDAAGSKPTPPPAIKTEVKPSVQSDPVEVKKPVAPPAPAGEVMTPAVAVDGVIEEESAPVGAADANLQSYTVKEGEDVYAVAIRWGVSPNEIKTLNNLKSIELTPGTVIKIPSNK